MYTVKKVIIATPRGFCAGVFRAVTIIDRLLELYPQESLYVRHAIVHNKHIIKRFEKRGVIFTETLENIPTGSKVVLSAHGSSPKLIQEAKDKNLIVINAECPLVTKVHIEAKKYAKDGYHILYIGHVGHPEPLGVMGEVQNKDITLITNLHDAKFVQIANTDKLIALTQTTLSFDDTKVILETLKQRFPKLMLPIAFDICYATQNRQEAVKELCKHTEMVLVFGSKTSSNANRLRDVAESCGVIAYLLDDIHELTINLLKGASVVGITSAASTPEDIVTDAILALTKHGAKLEELVVKKEQVIFPLPKLHIE